MAEIELSKGKIAIIDDEDYDRVSQYKWHYNKRGYACRTEYLGGGQKNKKTRMIWLHKFVVGVDSDVMVDHADGDKLNNRKENLRICNQQLNMFNRGPQKNNTTGYKGVSFDKRRSKYFAQLKAKGIKKGTFLGYFDTAEEAALAYNEAALKYFGEFAWLNTVEDKEKI